jgi:rhodanese-related sulfurtransferase
VDSIPYAIDVETLDAWRREGRDFVLLDVREDWELAICRFEAALHIPLQQLPARAGEVPGDRPVVTVCHHGMRSAQAMQWLRRMDLAQAVNLEGGIDAWARKIEPGMETY